jgi:hypothetical protein
VSAGVRLRVIGIKLESGVCQDSVNFARDALTRITPDYRASEGGDVSSRAFTRRSRSVSGRVNGLADRVARSFDAAGGGKKALVPD